MFFQGANYLEPTKYDEQYNNAICERENEAIKQIINNNINITINKNSNIIITDVGCGTGLGSELIDKRHQYIGIDRSSKSIAYCRKLNKEGVFIHSRAEEFIRNVTRVNPIFIFSLDYLSLSTIKAYIDKTDKIFIAIHYNKPYLSQTSVYKRKKWLYSLLHSEQKRNDLRALFEHYNGITYKLLNEDYYYVTIITKERQPWVYRN